MDVAKLLAWIWIVFYALIAAAFYITYEILLFDFFAYIGIAILLLFVFRRRKLNLGIIALFGIALLPHIVGVIPFDNGSLYSDAFFWGNYDLLTHFLGFTLLGFSSLLYFKPKTLKVSILVFFALMGVGMCVEMSEYVGYSLFDFGWGAFEFGDGDNSENFGPGGDSMTDAFANLGGIILAYLLYFSTLYLGWQRKTKRKKKKLSTLKKEIT